MVFPGYVTFNLFRFLFFLVVEHCCTAKKYFQHHRKILQRYSEVIGRIISCTEYYSNIENIFKLKKKKKVQPADRAEQRGENVYWPEKNIYMYIFLKFYH